MEDEDDVDDVEEVEDIDDVEGIDDVEDVEKDVGKPSVKQLAPKGTLLPNWKLWIGLMFFQVICNLPRSFWAALVHVVDAMFNHILVQDGPIITRIQNKKEMGTHLHEQNRKHFAHAQSPHVLLAH